MKRYLFSIFLIIISCFAFSQSNKIDSLLNLLKTVKEDTNKVKVMNGLSYQYKLIGEYDRGLTYAQKALTLAQNLGFKIGMAHAYNCIGALYAKKGNFTKALKNYFSTLKISKDIKNKKWKANTYIDIGNTYGQQGNYQEAIKNFFIALKEEDDLKDSKSTALCYEGIGNMYVFEGNYSEGLKYLFLALKIMEEAKNYRHVLNIYDNIGLAYHFQGNDPKALKNFLISLNISEKLGDKDAIANCYNNIAVIYDMQHNYPIALKNYQAALKIKEEIGDKDGMVVCLSNLGQLNVLLNHTKEAQVYLNKALKINAETGSKMRYEEIYIGLTALDSTKGDFKAAFEHHKLSVNYRDSINNEEIKIKTLETAMQYKSEKKEKEIAILNLDILTKQKDKELLSAQIDGKNTIIYSIVSLTILLAASGFLLFNMQKLKQKNSYQAEINKQQEINAIAIIQAQEKERNRIAQELHDGVGTFLSTLKINLQLLDKSISDEKKIAYEDALHLIDKTSTELRTIMKNLSSETLHEKGLVGALDELIQRVNRLGSTKIDFKHYGLTTRLDDIIEVNLYRVAQELINNCIKHSQATLATLQLIDHENTVLLMMEDNGKGFDTQNTKQPTDGGMGIANMRNRISFIKGTVKLETLLEKGTTFIIEIPKLHLL